MSTVSLSYSCHDTSLAPLVVDALTREGIDVWFDGRLTPGTNYINEITHQIREATIIIGRISRNSLEITLGCL